MEWLALFFRRKQSRMLGKKESKSDGELRRKHWFCIRGSISAGPHAPSTPGPLIRHKVYSYFVRGLRRFAAVSPFCFGYPAQPDIASWRIRIIHNHFDRPTLFSATRRQGRYPRSLEAFFFTPADFLSVSRHDARVPLERTKDVDLRRVQLSTEGCLKARKWIRRKRRRRRSIDEQASGCRSSEPLLSCSLRFSVIFPFLCWWTWEWAVVRLLRRRWTPAQDSCWSRLERRLLDVDLVSVFTISHSPFLWQCCTSIFISVVLHLCTRSMISRQSPLKQTDSSWILHLE